MTITMATSANQPISLTKAAATILGPLLVSLIIGGFTLIWKIDKLTETLTYRFETVSGQVKGHDSRLDEIDRRLRLLEIEVAMTGKRGR